jgi:hypothetical protein
MWKLALVPVLTLLFVLSSTPSVSARERPVAAEAVPVAVRAAVTKKYGAPERMSFTRERSRGAVIYEVSLTAQGRSLDVEISAGGQILVEEERISRDQLPAAVLHSLASSSSDRGEPVRIERVIEHEAIDAPRFEVVVRDRGALWELTYDRAGRLLTKERVRNAD